MMSEFEDPPSPQPKAIFGSHILKLRKEQFLLSYFLNLTKERGSSQKITGGSSSKQRGQVEVSTKSSSHQLLILLLWLIFCVFILSTED